MIEQSLASRRGEASTRECVYAVMWLVGRVEGEGMRMRGRLWGQVIHVPLGGSTEEALLSRRPARHRVGPSSVAVLPVAERVRPFVAAPTAYPAPVAVGCRHPVPPVGYRTG